VTQEVIAGQPLDTVAYCTPLRAAARRQDVASRRRAGCPPAQRSGVRPSSRCFGETALRLTGVRSGHSPWAGLPWASLASRGQV